MSRFAAQPQLNDAGAGVSVIVDDELVSETVSASCFDRNHCEAGRTPAMQAPGKLVEGEIWRRQSCRRISTSKMSLNSGRHECAANLKLIMRC